MSNCIPKAPLRCWQFFKGDQSPMPRWVVEAGTIMNGGVLEIDQVEGCFTFDADGEWLVEIPGGDDPVFACFTAAQFEAAFDTVPTAATADTSAQPEGET